MLALVIEAALRSLALAAAVWLVLRLFRVRDARAQKIVWTAVLCVSLLTPFVRHKQVVKVDSRLLVHALPVIQNLSPTSSVQQSIPPFIAPPYLPPAGRTVEALYSLIVIGLLGRLLLGLLLASWIWRKATPAPEDWHLSSDVRISDSVLTPAAVRSGILLPRSSKEWDKPKLRVVLAHERCHLQQGDFYWQLLAKLYTCFFWFSPFAWWLKKELNMLAEQVSDEAGVRASDGAVPYAEILLEFATGPRLHFEGAAMARAATIRTRIEHILDGSKRTAPISFRRRIVMVATVIPFVVFTAAFSLRLKGASDHKTLLSQKTSDEPYVIVSGDSTTMNGSSDDLPRARLFKNKISGDYLWFKHAGKEYIIDDPKLVRQAQRYFAPQEELGRKQEVLGEEQAKLGEQQAKLGELQSKIKVPAPDFQKDLTTLEAELRELRAKTKEMEQSDLSTLQSELAELQSKLGEAQSLAGDKQSALGARQSKLGEQQSKLGEQQGRLGEEQSRLAEEASKKVRVLLDDALRTGKAKRVD